MMNRSFTTLVAVPSLLLSLGVAGTGCSSKGNGGGTLDSGSGALSDDGTCVTLTATSASDLACASDDDCMVAWTGTVCSCGCYCGGAAMNTAAQAREQSAIESLAPTANCTTPSCLCPGVYGSRCVAHQCTLCGNPAFEGVDGGPPSCAEDAG